MSHKISYVHFMHVLLIKNHSHVFRIQILCAFYLTKIIFAFVDSVLPLSLYYIFFLSFSFFLCVFVSRSLLPVVSLCLYISVCLLAVYLSVIVSLLVSLCLWFLQWILPLKKSSEKSGGNSWVFQNIYFGSITFVKCSTLILQWKELAQKKRVEMFLEKLMANWLSWFQYGTSHFHPTCKLYLLRNHEYIYETLEFQLQNKVLAKCL